MTTPAEDAVQQQLTAYNARDLESFVSWYADDAVIFKNGAELRPVEHIRAAIECLTIQDETAEPPQEKPPTPACRTPARPSPHGLRARI